MQRGRIVEHGAVTEIFANPRHEYTASLLNSIPSGIAGTVRAPAVQRALRKEQLA